MLIDNLGLMEFLSEQLFHVLILQMQLLTLLLQPIKLMLPVSDLIQ